MFWFFSWNILKLNFLLHLYKNSKRIKNLSWTFLGTHVLTTWNIYNYVDQIYNFKYSNDVAGQLLVSHIFNARYLKFISFDENFFQFLSRRPSVFKWLTKVQSLSNSGNVIFTLFLIKYAPFRRKIRCPQQWQSKQQQKRRQPQARLLIEEPNTRIPFSLYLFFLF